MKDALIHWDSLSYRQPQWAARTCVIISMSFLIYFLHIKEAEMRTLIDIPEEDLKLLNNVVRKLEISRAEFIRRAINSSLAPHRGRMNHEAFGAWAALAEDGLAYQERMRAEW
jgi:hypothetical protein